jgi:Ser/Thr protein kinase RdoA (MazF antagonist)
MDAEVIKQRLTKDWTHVLSKHKSDSGKVWFDQRDLTNLEHDIYSVRSLLATSGSRHVHSCDVLLDLIENINSTDHWIQSVNKEIQTVLDALNFGDASSILKEIIIEALTYYDVGKLQSLELIEHGSVNYNVKIKTSKDTFFFRAYDEAQDKKHMVFEHKLLKKLSDKGFIVSSPLKTRLGETLLQIKGYYVSIFNWIKGRHFRYSISSIKTVARKLGSFHLLIKDYHPNPYERQKAYRNFLKKEKDYLNSILEHFFLGNYSHLYRLKYKPKLTPYDSFIKDNLEKMQPIYTNLVVNYQSLRFPIQEFIMLHGDYHEENVLFKRSKMVAMLDFDYARYGLRHYEVAETALRYSIDGKKIDLRNLRNFIKAYRSIDPWLKTKPICIIMIINLFIFRRFFSAYESDLESALHDRNPNSYIIEQANLIYWLFKYKNHMFQALS